MESATSVVTTLTTGDDEVEESSIKLIQIIFLPFHPIFQFLVVSTAILKVYMGPLSCTFNFIHCSKEARENTYLQYVIRYYVYVGDGVYILDTLLHIVHRQVEDESRKREYLPKSAFLILLDLFSVIPLFRMFVEGMCPPIRLWPNILCFNEILPIYRVVEYFSLMVTHSIFKLFLGYAITALLIINAIACLFLMLTFGGLCPKCNHKPYDWRAPFYSRYPEFGNNSNLQYLHGFQYVFGYVSHVLPDYLQPKTILNLNFTTLLMVIGYIIWTFLLIPKFFSESLLKLRHKYVFNTRVKKIISETERRNPDSHNIVEKYYSVIWDNWNGLTAIPDIVNSIPRHLILSIKQDLTWAFFHHSPTFRKTTLPYKRWLCEYINLEIKLAGERFFSGVHCYTNLYYIKSGIVQFFSSDDATSAMLSVSSGTIFGDISAIVPPLNRKVMVRCLTYCEVFVVPRATILASLHKFPEDRRNILKLVKRRMKHARDLYACKEPERGNDIVEDEDIEWIKRRWWQIANTINHHKRSKRASPYELPPEEKNHCAKYIGQLVLCRESRLQKKSMFVRDTFPWLLGDRSKFFRIWTFIVWITVYFVLLVFPPNIVRSIKQEPIWFSYVVSCVDLIFAADVAVLMFTAVEEQENTLSTFLSIVSYRFKNVFFMLDLLSTPWIDVISRAVGLSRFNHLFRFNRLLKAHVLFFNRTYVKWTRNNQPTNEALKDIYLCHVLLLYVIGYLLYVITLFIPGLTPEYFFYNHCMTTNSTDCFFFDHGILSLAAGYYYRMFYNIGAIPKLKTEMDAMIEIGFHGLVYTICLYTKSLFLGALYFKFRSKIHYQHFVRNLTNYYVKQKIHPDLMARLQRYLNCHWKYFGGADITQPNPMKDETFVVYWKCHGETAERILKQSVIFQGADPSLIRELAQRARILLLPKRAAMLLFGVQMYRLNWLLKGILKCEYQSDNNENIVNYVQPGEILAVLSVLYGGASLRTYTAASDCEILYITRVDFFDTVRRFPHDASIFEIALRDIKSEYTAIVGEYAMRHKEYKKDIQKKIFSARQSFVPNTMSMILSSKKFKKEYLKDNIITRFFKEFRTNPESRMIRVWMTFRMLCAIEQITYASLRGTRLIELPLYELMTFNVVINVLDVFFRVLKPYYDKDGKIISSLKKCFLYYVSHNLIIDVFNFVPVYRILYLYIGLNTEAYLFSRIGIGCLQFYIIVGWFNYITDSHKKSLAYGTVFKWQICTMLLMLIAASYFLGICIESIFVEKDIKNSHCWMPVYLDIPLYPKRSDKNLVFLQALVITQSYFERVSTSVFNIIYSQIYRHLAMYIVLGFIFWWGMCQCQAVLILNYKGDSAYYEGYKQLMMFLKSERVDKELMSNVSAYYHNLLIRTSGLDLRNLMCERLGVVFRQDLNYYFYQTAFTSCSKLLGGDNNFERQLASHVTEVHFLPDQEIMRELRLTPNIFIVNRGRVSIYKEGKKLVTLTKGSIFGQMIGATVRPVKCSAQADEHTDVLQLTVKEFQSILSTQLKKDMKQNPHIKQDFLVCTELRNEDPYDTIPYLLRGKKVIKLPRMRSPVEYDTDKWYYRWLFMSWFIWPVVTCVLSLLVGVINEKDHVTGLLHNTAASNRLYALLVLLDLVFLTYVVSEFYTMEIVVKNNRIVYSYRRLRKLKNVWLYIDIISLIFPWLSLFTNVWVFHLARLPRIHLLYYLDKYFCKNMKVNFLPLLLKTVSVLLLLHTLTCLWIYGICRTGWTLQQHDVPDHILNTYDPQSYTKSKGRFGCARITPPFKYGNTTDMRAFLEVQDWVHDYCLSLTFVVSLFTRTNVDLIPPRTQRATLLRVVIKLLALFLDLYISSFAISTAYNKIRDTYQYDYRVKQLIMYLKRHGLSNTLLATIENYTTHLWQIHKGCWLPEVTNRAPQCMREDIMVSLYIHHLHNPPLFMDLPPYFMRQLATRLDRIVIYPGKCIVQEGDIYPCIFFIHEGEVERWYTDASGESRLSAVLSINNYFGMIPGLFPNTPYQFAYYSRTVCDLVYLNFDAWQDLLNGFPEIKYELYRAAIQFKRETGI